MSLQVSIDLRPTFGAIRDQGSRPTCVAFAVSDVHAVARGRYDPLSAEHIFYHAVQRTPGTDPEEGVSLPTILEALEQDGQSREAGWPYLLGLPSDLSNWKPPSTATPVFKRASLMGASTTKTITDHLDAGRPVAVTLLISEAFCEAEHGIIRFRAKDTDVDWHGVIAVGYADEGKKRLILIRNSWGASWGLNGYAWVETDYLDPRAGFLATMS